MATKQYTYQTRYLAATPRNKRLTESIQSAAQSGGGGIGYVPSSTPQYWQLVTTDAEGNPLDEAQYYLQPVSGQHLRMPGDVVAYAVDPAEPMQLPVAADYNTTGLFRAKEGGGLLYDSVANAWYVDPEFQGGGGIDEGQLEEYLTTNKYITQDYLQQNGYLTWQSQLTAYQKPDAYSPITPTDTLLAAIGKLEANFGNYVDLTTNQTVGGVKTFTERVLSEKDVIAYAVGDEADLGLPVTGYATTGLVRIKEGGGIIVDSSGIISVDPEYAGGGGVDFTAGTALQLTSAGVLNVLIGTTSGTVCAGNDSRLSNDRPNPYALSWSGYSSGSYDGSSAKSIVIPSNTNQLTNGAGFIYDANGIITVLSGSGSSSKYLAGNGTFYTISYSELSGTPDLGLYVRKAGDTMTGNLTVSNSAAGINIKGSNTGGFLGLYLGSNYWQFQISSNRDLRILNNGSIAAYFSGYNNGNFVANGTIIAQGDVVAYSSGGDFSDFVPVASTSVYGIVRYDGTTIGKNSSGQLYVIGGSSGGGGTSVSWGVSGSEYAELTVGSTMKRVSLNGHTHVWSQIGSKPSWIGSSKPSYSWSEISGKPSIISSISVARSGSGNAVGSLSVSGSTIYYNMTNISSGSSSWNGGTVSNNITISNSAGGMNIKGSSTGGFLGLYRGSRYWQLQISSSYDLNFLKDGSRVVYFSGVNSGNVWIQGSLVQNSDMRLKTVVNRLDSCLDKIIGLDVFRYILNNDMAKKVRIGMSAQQVNSVYPEFVYMTDEGYYAMDYSSLSSLAIQGIKELYARFRPVESKVKVLEQRVRNLQSRLDNAYREIFNLKEGKEEVA